MRHEELKRGTKNTEDHTTTGRTFKQWFESQGLVSSTQQALGILGLSPGASKEEITTAYLRKSRQFHPDQGGTLEDQKLVNAAFAWFKENGFNSSSGSRFTFDDDDYSVPPWQTDGRASHNRVGKDFRDINFCKKAIYEKAMELGGLLLVYTIAAFDGRYFRGTFTVYSSPKALGYAGMVMEKWNSEGANPYETDAVFAVHNTDVDKKLLLLRVRGKDVTDKKISFMPDEWPAWNDQAFCRKLKEKYDAAVAEKKEEVSADEPVDWELRRERGQENWAAKSRFGEYYLEHVSVNSRYVGYIVYFSYQNGRWEEIARTKSLARAKMAATKHHRIIANNRKHSFHSM